MKTLFAFVIATIYGLLLRFFFAFYNNITEVISISMVVLAPVAIGYLTVALIGLKNIRSRTASFFVPWLTSMVLLFVTIALAMEGAICWIMIYPFFAIAAGIGGLIAYTVMRNKERRLKNEKRDDVLDDFDRNGTLKTSLILVFPFIFGLIEQDRLLTPAEYTVVCETTIAAPPAAVWQTLTRVEPLDPEHNNSFFTGLFGLPRHLRTELDTLAVGGRRTAYYERGLYFEEKIIRYEPESVMTVAIKADPGNVPPTVLDEHIVVGGRHFKALEDTYKLTPLPDGTCKLELSGRISINTPFNWYSGLWARGVLADLFQDQLRQIGERASRR